MAIDIKNLKEEYFFFDKPVEYKLDMDKSISIKPVSLYDSTAFLCGAELLSIDKNSLPYPEIISMNYLQFLCVVLMADKKNADKILRLFDICFGWKNSTFVLDKNKKFYLLNTDDNTYISAKQFDDIRRIILYQNIVDYDDSYINPDVKKAMEEYDRVKNNGLDLPNLERRIAIITAHCGLSKNEQLSMTYREHTVLFKEVCEEVEFTTTRTVAIIGNALSKHKSEIEHWIFKKKNNKFDKYFTAEEKYNKDMGGDGSIKKTNGYIGDLLLNQYNSINN